VTDDALRIELLIRLRHEAQRLDRRPSAVERIILEAVCFAPEFWLTYEALVALFDDDEFPEVDAAITTLRDEGALYQWDDGGPADDFELRYYQTIKGQAMLYACRPARLRRLLALIPPLA